MFNIYKPTNWLLFSLLVVLIEGNSYYVDIVDNAPIVRGAAVNFTARLLDGDNLADGTFEFIWSDNALPSHKQSFKTTDQPVTNWTVRYDHNVYPPGPYEVQVVVRKWIFNLYPYDVTSNRKLFFITDALNGDLSLMQNNVTRKNFISTASAVVYNINLTRPDAVYLSNATSITSYWFIDCIYYGPVDGMSFTVDQFTSGDEIHTVEVLVMADFTPPPPPTPKPTTTPKPNVTTISPNVTTNKPNVTTVSSVTPWWNSNLKLEITPKNQSIQHLQVIVNGKLTKYNGSFPYVCNGTNIAIDDKKTYGYFSSKVTTKNPITAVNITGNNWLEHGQLLELNVVCNGSTEIKYCYEFHYGHYNMTGNETCDVAYQVSPCNFLVQRFLSPNTHTLIIILENDVSRVIKPVTITVYDVKKQAQLSVVVVPVLCSLVAVVMVIFGIAYYIQNRSRFMVEVADFNFGVDYSDLEYKTFKERLRDSFLSTFTRESSPEPSEAPTWPPGQTYGSMT